MKPHCDRSPASVKPEFAEERRMPPADPDATLATPSPAPGWAEKALAAEKPAPSRIDRYEILGMVTHGAGGMGVVYQARDKELNRMVAVKLMKAGNFASEGERARFLVEAKAVASLAHPHVMPVYDFGESGDGPWFVMPLMDGGSLAARIETGNLSPAEAVEVMLPICQAVQHAHDQGVLHRDLKPANILLTGEGKPVVADFGLAKRMIGDFTALTASGSIMGTPNFMPPEQARGDDATKLSDVYSLGALLYNLVTGHPPAEGKTPVETLRQVLEELPRRPSIAAPNVDPKLDTIIMKCLEKSPVHRYPSAEALAGDLKNWSLGTRIAARDASPFSKLWRWAKRKPAAATIAGISVASLLGFIAFLIKHNHDLTTQRDRTERVRRNAEELVATAMTDYRDTVEKTVGRLDALDQITGSVDAYFRGLPDELRDERADFLQARLLTLRGEVAGSKGELDAAAASLTAAAALADKYGAGERSFGWPLLEAATWVERTDVALKQDDAAAMDFARRAVDAARRSLAAAPGDMEALRQHGLASFFLGRCQYKAQQPEAADTLETSLAAARRVAEAAPDHLQKKIELEWAMVELAKVKKTRGAGILRNIREGRAKGNEAAEKGRATDLLSQARELYQSAENLISPHVDREPWNFPLRRDLGVIADGLGDVALQFDDHATALSQYQRCLDHAKALVAHDDRNVEWLRELAVANKGMADALGETKRPSEAKPYLDEAVEIRRRLIDIDPSSGKNQREFVLALQAIGNSHMAARRPAEALALYSEAELKALEFSNTDRQPAWWQNKRVSLLNHIAAMQSALDGTDKSRALATLAASIQIADQLVASRQISAEGESSSREARKLLQALRARQ